MEAAAADGGDQGEEQPGEVQPDCHAQVPAPGLKLYPDRSGSQEFVLEKEEPGAWEDQSKARVLGEELCGTHSCYEHKLQYRDMKKDLLQCGGSETF